MAGQQSGWASALVGLLGYEAWSLQWGMPGWSTAGGNVWASATSDAAAGAKTTTPTPAGSAHLLPSLAGDPSDPSTLLRDRVAAVFSGGMKMITWPAVATELDTWFVVAYQDEPGYAAGHLPGAVLMRPGVDLDDTAKLALLPPESRILVYDCTGEASSGVAAALRVLGYAATFLEFGMNALWHSDLGACAWGSELSAGLPLVVE